MKILTCLQQKDADAYTISATPISSIDLMERAAEQLTREITQRYAKTNRFVVFAGPGNNGGDAAAVARMLHEQGYKVEFYLFNTKDRLSADCAENVQRLHRIGFSAIHEIRSSFEPPRLDSNDVVIDGLYGSGLNKPLSGGYALLVRYLNASDAKVVSIDLPSGLMGEDNSYNIRQNIVRADLTLSIQLPKLSFLFAENQEFIGEWKLLDIGISQDYIESVESDYRIIEESEIKRMIHRRDKFSHKGTYGHGLLIAGSYGMAGSSVLAARAAMRSGIGKLTVHAPICNHDILQITVPEVMVQDDVHDRYFAEPVELDSYQAVAIGPGLGIEEDTALALFDQVRSCYIPLVLDADALNIFSSHRNHMNVLPKRSILTPHVKELERIVGKCSNSFERLKKAVELADYLQSYIILKGAWTTVITPEGRVAFNPTGNPGMATAGSGDVLTGIILSLLAQDYTAEQACLLGVYVHGLAGDIAAERMGMTGMTAGDIVSALPYAFLELRVKS